jgi:hypothetical protein
MTNTAAAANVAIIFQAGGRGRLNDFHVGHYHARQSGKTLAQGWARAVSRKAPVGNKGPRLRAVFFSRRINVSSASLFAADDSPATPMHASMNELPRQTLGRIIAKHGRGICGEPKRVEAMLRDLCGAYRREINIIVGALEERVAADLTAAGNSIPRGVLLARLEARLRDNLAYTPEAARWGVETWALALGVLSEAELLARARAETAERGESERPPHARASNPPATNPGGISAEPPLTRRGPAYAPPLSPQQSPPPHSPPPIARTHAPGRAPRMSPTVPAAGPPQQDVSPPPALAQARRRGPRMRGCLIVVVFLLLVLAAVFVVPAVISILREEQSQPSINDPRVR